MTDKFQILIDHLKAMEKRLITKIEGKRSFRENTNQKSGVNSSAQSKNWEPPDEGPVASAEELGNIMGGSGLAPTSNNDQDAEGPDSAQLNS